MGTKDFVRRSHSGNAGYFRMLECILMHIVTARLLGSLYCCSSPAGMWTCEDMRGWHSGGDGGVHKGVVEECTGKVHLAAVRYVICFQELVRARLQRSEDALLSAGP